MKIENICVKKTYTDKQGNEKAQWLQVGMLKTSDKGKQFIELNMFPNTSFYVFEQKDRSQAPVELTGEVPF